MQPTSELIWNHWWSEKLVKPWWRHQMEVLPALLALCEGNPPVTGGFPSQSPVTRSCNVFLDARLKWLPVIWDVMALIMTSLMLFCQYFVYRCAWTSADTVVTQSGPRVNIIIHNIWKLPSMMLLPSWFCSFSLVRRRSHFADHKNHPPSLTNEMKKHWGVLDALIFKTDMRW